MTDDARVVAAREALQQEIAEQGLGTGHMLWLHVEDYAAAERATRDAEVAALVEAIQEIDRDPIYDPLDKAYVIRARQWDVVRAALRPFLTEEAKPGGPQPAQEPLGGD